MRQKAPSAVQLPTEGTLPSLAGATGWLNSAPITAASVQGKVVLIDFWTYTCVNWRRTLPYIRAWAERYKDRGLVVIGVHTPEFDIEKDVESIRHATQEMRINYPIAIDSNYEIWNAFNNQYWPALYIIDARGRIRHHQFGEGGYAQAELVIQHLLAEAGSGGLTQDLTSVDTDGFELPADESDLRSPETYIGLARATNFSSPGGAKSGSKHLYAIPGRLGLNQWALSGDWTLGNESAVLNSAPGRIVYRFHSRDLNLIMGPAARGASVRFRVLIDGQPPGVSHGVDVDAEGNGAIGESRMYQLIRQPKPITDRQFEIEFLDSGVAAFDFTFG